MPLEMLIRHLVHFVAEINIYQIVNVIFLSIHLHSFGKYYFKSNHVDFKLSCRQIFLKVGCIRFNASLTMNIKMGVYHPKRNEYIVFTFREEATFGSERKIKEKNDL